MVDHMPNATFDPGARDAITRLLTEFSARVDEGRAATVHELFVEDATIETPQFVLRSRDAIRERFTARARDTSRRTRHYWSNARFSGGPTEVTVITNVMTVIASAGVPTILTGGTSTDVVVHDGAGWAFRSRRLDVAFEGTLGPVAPGP